MSIGLTALAALAAAMVPDSPEIRVFTHEDGELDQGQAISGVLEGVLDAYAEIAIVSPRFLREYAIEEYMIPRPVVHERQGQVGLLTGVELPAELRGRGLGTRLLLAMLEEARRQGLTAVYGASERAPLSLYLRLGAQNLGMSPMGYLVWVRFDLSTPAQGARSLGPG